MSSAITASRAGICIDVFVEESRHGSLSSRRPSARDHPTMQRLSHAQSSAGAVGARLMEQVCGRIHEAALEGRTGNATELQGTLERCFDLTSDLLRTGCPSLGRRAAAADQRVARRSRRVRPPAVSARAWCQLLRTPIAAVTTRSWKVSRSLACGSGSAGTATSRKSQRGPSLP